MLNKRCNGARVGVQKKIHILCGSAMYAAYADSISRNAPGVTSAVPTYITPLVFWLPAAFIIYLNRGVLLSFKTDLPVILNIAGVLLLGSGTALHIWTGKLLSLWGLMGLPEISEKVKGKLVTGGPYSVVRHPTYLAHTLMFLGVFLITGATAVGIITAVDIVVINAVVIPLEERELGRRFGKEYEEYREKVPAFFPWL
jgi:protein-S-isoprenylcysteine O-methyltransferase Ste14